MLIFTGVEYDDLGLSPDEIQGRMGKWFAWHEKMEKKGIVKYGEALHAKSRIIAGKDRMVTDKASAEAKEIIGGFYVIKAKDFDEAEKVAQDFPDYDLGSSVHIRETVIFE